MRTSRTAILFLGHMSSNSLANKVTCACSFGVQIKVVIFVIKQ